MRMRPFLLLQRACALAATALPLLSSAPGEEPLARAFAAQLDDDRALERIEVRLTGERDEQSFHHLVVRDGDGSEIWRGPASYDTDDPLVFGEWHFGCSLPELVADIDGDGRIELVAPAPQSDVSPTFFRVLRWDGRRFVSVRDNRALMRDAREPSVFRWAKPKDWHGCWIGGFKSQAKGGAWVVEVYDMASGGDLRTGRALVAPGPGGFRVDRWVEPLARPAAEPDMPPPGSGYRARLSDRDHTSSAGKRLASPIAILQQDRANVHQFGKRDSEDETDGCFGDPKARRRLGAMRVLCGDPKWQARILEGTPVVSVVFREGFVEVRILSD